MGREGIGGNFLRDSLPDVMPQVVPGPVVHLVRRVHDQRQPVMPISWHPESNWSTFARAAFFGLTLTVSSAARAAAAQMFRAAIVLGVARMSDDAHPWLRRLLIDRAGRAVGPRGHSFRAAVARSAIANAHGRSNIVPTLIGDRNRLHAFLHSVVATIAPIWDVRSRRPAAPLRTLLRSAIVMQSRSSATGVARPLLRHCRAWNQISAALGRSRWPGAKEDPLADCLVFRTQPARFDGTDNAARTCSRNQRLAASPAAFSAQYM